MIVRLRLLNISSMWLNKAQSLGGTLKCNFYQEIPLIMILMCITSLYLLNMNINQNIYDVLIAFWLILLNFFHSQINRRCHHWLRALTRKLRNYCSPRLRPGRKKYKRMKLPKVSRCLSDSKCNLINATTTKMFKGISTCQQTVQIVKFSSFLSDVTELKNHSN